MQIHTGEIDMVNFNKISKMWKQYNIIKLNI